MFNQFYQQIATNRLSHWLNVLPSQLHTWYMNNRHGDFKQWQKSIDALPTLPKDNIDLANSVSVSSNEDISDGLKLRIEQLLKNLKPWRKGPYHIHGVDIDTEWRSDYKWQRLLPFIDNLTDKYVLDIGCGSGYHLWRMKGEGAKFVVGIDPTQLFFMQFQAIQHFVNESSVNLLPIGVDDLPPLQSFDTVFAMGVLYHRKSPIDFLHQLKAQLVKGGQLVLETLVIEGDENSVLVPKDRYAKMRNVWFIPSSAALVLWLERVGFNNIKVVNIDQTQFDEQRKTDWIDTESLSDFLDPNDSNKTIEGYPAPKRAIITANA